MRQKLMLVCSVAAICALAAVATALAAGGSSKQSSHRNGTRASTNEAGSPPAGFPGAGPGGRDGAVHSESVVLNKAGTGYITVTADSGTVKSVEASSGKLTIAEGTKTVTYKTVTLTIGSEAKVTLDGKSSSLEKLAEGDHVMVRSSSEGAYVMASDSSFKTEAGPHGGPGHGGPPSGEWATGE